MVFTSDSSYSLGLKPRITFKSLDGNTVNYQYNAHDTSGAPIIVKYLDCDNSIGETGTFNIVIADPNNEVDKDLLRNSKVYIEMGKTEGELKHFLIGFADIFDVSRPASNYQEYRLSGFGSSIQANELLLLIRKSAKLDDDDNLISDPNYSVGRLFERSLTEKKFRPLNDKKIGDITGWASRGVDIGDLKTQFLVINEVFTTLWDFYDRMAAIEGANWWVDYTDGDENLTCKHPSKLHSGVSIKSGDLKSASDDATKISYIKGPFNWTEDSSLNAGVRTALYTTTIIDRFKIAEQKVRSGSSNVNKRFIAQQITIPEDERRITSIALRVHKVGEPESPKSRVNGRIILDDNNTPKGDIIGKFSLSLSDIEDDSNWILADKIDLKTDQIQGITKIWLVLLDRSGIKGDVEDDANNTVFWHHDNSFVAHTAGSYSATVAIDNENDRDNSNEQNWVVSTSGPQYTYKIFSDIKRMQSRTNQGAAAILRQKEAFIDSSFLHLPSSINKFLSLNLSPMSKPRITISNLQTSIPNNFIFTPYKYVTFLDKLSGLEQDLQITSVRYTFSGLPGDPQYACYTADLSLSSSFNPLIGSCNCL